MPTSRGFSTGAYVPGGTAGQILYVGATGVLAQLPAPTDGYFLKYTTAGGYAWAAASVSPSGADTQLQYNSSGSFAGAAALTWTNSTSTLKTTNLNVNSSNMTDALTGGSATGFKATVGATAIALSEAGTGAGWLSLSNGTTTGYVGHLNATTGFTLGASTNHFVTIRQNDKNNIQIDTNGRTLVGNVANTGNIASSAVGQLNVYPATAATLGVTVTSYASQTGALVQSNDSSGNRLHAFGAGGSLYLPMASQTASANVTLTVTSKQLQSITPATTNRDVNLPDISSGNYSGISFVIRNSATSGVLALLVKDSGGTQVGYNLPPQGVLQVVANGTAWEVW
jgi:hypothetical protein